jgi:hypothetical protein
MINKKAQTLTELATFGSVLLLVLSFFVSYGMRYNYDQDAQMRSFRLAMQEAYSNSRPDASGSVILVEDKHIPDPRDTFGVGNIVPVQANAEVTWGNTLQDRYTDLTDYSRLPRMKYRINSTAVEYRTAGFGFITTGNEFYAELPDSTTPQLITWGKVRCYQPTKDSPKQAMVVIENGPGDEDNETEVIDAVYLKPVGLPMQYVKMQVIGVKPVTAKQGDPLTRLDLLSPSSGQINPNYLNLGGDTGNVDAVGNPIYVTPATLQGLLLDDMLIKRNDSLTITQAPGVSNTVRSTSKPDFTAEITHKIRSNSDTPDDPDKFISSVSYNTKEGPPAWEIKIKE